MNFECTTQNQASCLIIILKHMLHITFQSEEKIEKQLYFPNVFKPLVFNHLIQCLAQINETRDIESLKTWESIRVKIVTGEIQNAIDILIDHKKTIAFLEEMEDKKQAAIIEITRITGLESYRKIWSQITK